ncbi:MAG: TonB-dependent receptor [Rikenellaceae bacterium]|nr:TonB-dependent receptor [Rikenellaceae bacterium]
MKKLRLLILLSLITGQLLYSQTEKRGVVTGTVIDNEDGTPLIGAIVVVDSTSQITTDVRGEFLLNNIRMDREVEMEVSFIGYETFFRDIKVDTLTNVGVIKLNRADYILDAARIEVEAPMMVQKGDTLQFNASQFKTNPDADASDLVNKLPGMEVEEGSVKAQGETITRVYVDGKLTFGDEPMTALQTLPADLVQSIQMFDELSDENKFLGINDGRTNRALNVVTKTGNVNKAITARIEAGYGAELEKNMDGKYQNRYTVNGETNIFTQKNRWTIGFNINNVNSSGGRGGYRGFGGGGGGNTTAHMVNLNYSKDWGDYLKLNASYTLNHRDSETIRRSIQNYFPTDDIVERINADSTWNNNDSYNHNGNIRLEYTMNENNRFMFTPRFSFSTSDSRSINHTMSNSFLTNGEEVYNETYTHNTSDTKNYNIEGNLMWNRRLGNNGRALTSSFSGRISENDGTRFQLDTTEVSTNPMNKYIDSWSWDRQLGVRLNYSEPLGESSRINVMYNIRYEKSKAYKMVYDWITGEEVVDEQLSNIYTRNYTTNNVGAGYNFNKNDWTINANLNYEHSKLNRDQEFPDVPLNYRPSYTFDNVLPNVNVRYSAGRNKDLRFTYNTRVSLPTVEQLQSVVDDSNPLQLTAGNPELKETYTHNIRLIYRSSQPENSSTFYVNLNADAIQNNISTKTEYFTEDTNLGGQYGYYEAPIGSQLRTPVNLNGYFSLSSAVGYSFPFSAIKTTISLDGNYAFRRSPSYTGDMLNHANSNEMGVRVKFASNISENVDFTVSSNTGYSYVTNSAKSNTKYVTETVSGTVSIIFLGGFTFTSDIAYRYNHSMSSTGFTQTYTLWNAGIGRKFLKRNNAELRITMYDILKQNANLAHTINDNYISDTWTNTIGRYLMLTFSYRFNTLNQQSQRGDREGGREREGGFPGGERGPRGSFGGPGGAPGGGFGGSGGGMR